MQPDATLHLARVKYYDPMAGAARTKERDQICWMKPIEFAWHPEARLVVLGAEPKDERINIRITLPDGLLSLI
jgi:hypothetical protein